MRNDAAIPCLQKESQYLKELLKAMFVLNNNSCLTCLE